MKMQDLNIKSSIPGLNEFIETIIQQSEHDGLISHQKLFTNLVHSMPVLMIHGFINTWLAMNNKSIERIINKAFNQPEHEHLHGLLKVCEYDFLQFFEKLDEKARGKLLEWIMENYSGIDFTSVVNRYR